MLNDWLDSEEFYNAMQCYRIAPLVPQQPVIEAFENVKRLIREHAAQPPAVSAEQWLPGAPVWPWSDEWFIAITTFGDRVVLRALPDEYTYDFKTADDTYIMRDKIAKWMQFPDSEFKAPLPSIDAQDAARYRWLRADEVGRSAVFDAFSENDLDSAIDEAMAKWGQP